MNVGRSSRCLAHRDNDLVQPLRNVSCRVQAGNRCLRMIVNFQPARFVRLSAKRRRQAGPVLDAERRVHHIEPVVSFGSRCPCINRAAIQSQS